MEEFNLIRHGHKMAAVESRVALEDSNLTDDQRAVWQEAVSRLGLKDPEITYDTLPQIEAMAVKMCEELPEKALIIFNSTNTPRTKMTVDLLSTYVHQEGLKHEKNIATAFLWEPKEVATQKDSMTNISAGVGTDVMLKMMEGVREKKDTENKDEFSNYLSQAGGVRHVDEDSLVMKAANKDLASENSAFKRRAAVLKNQIENLTDSFSNEDRPVYFYGVGHHGSVVAVDVAFNGREHYDSLNQIPQPLHLMKIKLKNEK